MKYVIQLLYLLVFVSLIAFVSRLFNGTFALLGFFLLPPAYAYFFSGVLSVLLGVLIYLMADDSRLTNTWGIWLFRFLLVNEALMFIASIFILDEILVYFDISLAIVLVNQLFFCLLFAMVLFIFKENKDYFGSL